MCVINSKYLLSAERSSGTNINESHIDTYVRANANYSVELHYRKRIWSTRYCYFYIDGSVRADIVPNLYQPAMGA